MSNETHQAIARESREQIEMIEGFDRGSVKAREQADSIILAAIEKAHNAALVADTRLWATEAHNSATSGQKLRDQLLQAQATMAAGQDLAKLLRDSYWAQTPLDVARLADKVLDTKVDLSVLDKHDAEVYQKGFKDGASKLKFDSETEIAIQREHDDQVRKPLVDALGALVRECKAQDILLGSLIGDADDALAKAKESTADAKTDLPSDAAVLTEAQDLGL